MEVLVWPLTKLDSFTPSRTRSKSIAREEQGKHIALRYVNKEAERSKQVTGLLLAS